MSDRFAITVGALACVGVLAVAAVSLRGQTSAAKSTGAKVAGAAKSAQSSPHTLGVS